MAGAARLDAGRAAREAPADLGSGGGGWGRGVGAKEGWEAEWRRAGAFAHARWMRGGEREGAGGGASARHHRVHIEHQTALRNPVF